MVVDLPRLSISEVTTYFATPKEDIDAYAAAGVQGIGIWEYKLSDGRDDEVVAAMREAGLSATICCGKVPSVIPDLYFREPRDPRDRVKAMCAGIERLARFDPVAVLCVTGDPRGHDPTWAYDVTVEGLRTVARFAADLGVTLGVEPLRQTSGSLVTTLPDTIKLIDDVGASNVAMVADVWHFWDLPAIADHLRRYVDRIIGVQLNDYRSPTRGWCDRVLPGDGVIDLRSILGLLDSAGFQGWYDIEVFSDNGIFGNPYEDSLWNVAPRELANRAVQSFRTVWESRRRDGA